MARTTFCNKMDIFAYPASARNYRSFLYHLLVRVVILLVILIQIQTRALALAPDPNRPKHASACIPTSAFFASGSVGSDPVLLVIIMRGALHAHSLF